MRTILSDTSGIAGRRLTIVQIRQLISVLPGKQGNPLVHRLTVIHPPLPFLARLDRYLDRNSLDDQLYRQAALRNA